jgi:phosphate transport system substrate-binding protein
MRISKISKVAILATAALMAVVPSAVAYDLTGQGSSAVGNFIEKCKVAYQASTKDTFTYAATGSGDGRTAINNGTKDIGYSDGVNTTAPAGVFHIPAAVWPIAIAYNLNNSASKQLQLSVPTIAGIFSGAITRWNDPAIVADTQKVRNIPVYKVSGGKTVLDANGSPVVDHYRKLTVPMTMPDKPITVLYRTGTSGTTENFTKALAAAAPSVWTKAGSNNFATANPLDISTRPATFQGFATSATIAAGAAAQKYSITYVEPSYVALNPALKIAAVINNAGNSVTPDVAGAQAMFAASDFNETTGIVTWAYTTKSPAAYLFTAPTYAMVKSNYGDAAKAAAVKRQVEFMAFGCSDTVKDEPMIPISKTSDLGKAILKLTAKIA